MQARCVPSCVYENNIGEGGNISWVINQEVWTAPPQRLRCSAGQLVLPGEGAPVVNLPGNLWVL